MWDPETDACDYCRECEHFLKEECKYFLYECLGDVEPCFEFLPKTSSKLKKVEIEIDNETSL